MTPKKSTPHLLFAAVAGAVLSAGAWAQTAPAVESRATVNAQTRQAAATGKLQPAGEAPDPIGGSASPRPSGTKGVTHHRRHGHKAKHRNRSTAHQTAPRSAAQPSPEPMTEPKK